MTKSEIDILLDGIDEPLAAVIAFGYYAGPRISEVVNLQPKNIDLQNNLIKVMGKGRDDFEPVPVLPQLKLYIKDFRGFDFGDK